MMHPILPARIGWHQGLTGLLTMSQYGEPSEARFTRTNPVVFAQPNQPKANGEHACMGEYCYCRVRVLGTGTRRQTLGYVIEKRLGTKGAHWRSHSGNFGVLLY